MSAVPRNEPLYQIDFRKEWQGSAKTNRLMAELRRLREEDPKTKCVIFSQWTLMLDLVEIPLGMDGFQFLRLDGTSALLALFLLFTDIRLHCNIIHIR